MYQTNKTNNQENKTSQEEILLDLLADKLLGILAKVLTSKILKLKLMFLGVTFKDNTKKQIFTKKTNFYNRVKTKCNDHIHHLNNKTTDEKRIVELLINKINDWLLSDNGKEESVQAIKIKFENSLAKMLNYDAVNFIQELINLRKKYKFVLTDLNTPVPYLEGLLQQRANPSLLTRMVDWTGQALREERKNVKISNDAFTLMNSMLGILQLQLVIICCLSYILTTAVSYLLIDEDNPDLTGRLNYWIWLILVFLSTILSKFLTSWLKNGMFSPKLDFNQELQKYFKEEIGKSIRGHNLFITERQQQNPRSQQLTAVSPNIVTPNVIATKSSDSNCAPTIVKQKNIKNTYENKKSKNNKPYIKNSKIPAITNTQSAENVVDAHLQVNEFRINQPSRPKGAPHTVIRFDSDAIQRSNSLDEDLFTNGLFKLKNVLHSSPRFITAGSKGESGVKPVTKKEIRGNPESPVVKIKAPSTPWRCWFIQQETRVIQTRNESRNEEEIRINYYEPVAFVKK